MYKLVFKPFFFLFPPEEAHYLAINLLEFIIRIPGVKWLMKQSFQSSALSLQRDLIGLHFSNPVGLAAGFDKDARHLEALSLLGFGFIEIGTVTPLPQPGNEPPRSFRLPKDEGLINRMGFNNEGVHVVALRLKKWKSFSKTPLIIGVNIGKNKNTPPENVIRDYEICFHELFDVVDYFTVNVSSPNTLGLRELQEKEPLKKLLTRLQEINNEKQFPKPILLKIAPDLPNSQIDDIIEIILETKIAGIIATNTTISREHLITSQEEIHKIGNGGLSGKPLSKISTHFTRYIAEKAKKRFLIISVGGIHSANDAAMKLEAGADLVQIYTGMIYEGPGLIQKINKSLAKKIT
ncbi:MAG: quinone-dependent dihydroorotate dehydrogenase [Chitinophagales bacterium]|nr:quinone-dependent dihydroorotate dehydrogenase [Chitinophagales bacterium]